MPHGRRQRRGNGWSCQALEGLEERAGSPRTHSLPPEYRSPIQTKAEVWRQAEVGCFLNGFGGRKQTSTHHPLTVTLD